MSISTENPAAIEAIRIRWEDHCDGQDHPDGTGRHGEHEVQAMLGTRAAVEMKAATGQLEWRDLLAAGIAATYAKTDPELLRNALIDVGVCVVAWIDAIDRRPAPAAPSGSESAA